MLRIAKLPIAIFALFIIIFPWMARQIPAIDHYTDIMVFAGIYPVETSEYEESTHLGSSEVETGDGHKRQMEYLNIH